MPGGKAGIIGGLRDMVKVKLDPISPADPVFTDFPGRPDPAPGIQGRSGRIGFQIPEACLG